MHVSDSAECSDPSMESRIQGLLCALTQYPPSFFGQPQTVGFVQHSARAGCASCARRATSISKAVTSRGRCRRPENVACQLSMAHPLKGPTYTVTKGYQQVIESTARIYIDLAPHTVSKLADYCMNARPRTLRYSPDTS